MQLGFSSKVLSVAFVLGMVVLYSSYSSSLLDSDFLILFRYGVMVNDEFGKNVLDTFHGTYTKDMVCDSPIKVKICLTKEELDAIYQKMGR